MILYGSHARGDADDFSDVDVLVAGPREPSVEDIVRLLPSLCQEVLHISHYTWAELEAMSRYGSLFLHHIAAEATALLYEGNAEERMATLLDSLSSYKLAKRDLVAFRSTIEDVERGLAGGSTSMF